MRPVSQEQISTKRQSLPAQASGFNSGGAAALSGGRLRNAMLPLLCFLITLSLTIPAFAQSKITGTVHDEKDQPLPGASITIKGTSNGTQSDATGHYSLSVSSGQVVVFSMVGYSPYQVTIGTQTTINAKLLPANSSLNEVVVVGYGAQRKATLTGAVSSISNAEIVTTKNENILNTLSGKIAGLRNVENTAEPGALTNNYDIRGYPGSPLIVIDGIPRPDIARVDPNDVESISVLKDAAASIYGVRGGNGVILITTKKGKNGALELDYTGTYGLQVPSRFSKPVDAIDYMTLANEKAVHNLAAGVKGTPTYSAANFADYQNGTKQSTDWYAATVLNSAPQQQHNLSANGGNDRTNYYLSAGFTGQDGLLRTKDLNYKRYNIRSNVSTKVSKNLTFDLNLSGTMDVKNQPDQAAYWIFRAMWYQTPVQPIYANNNPLYLNNAASLSPIAFADADISGYQTFNNKWFQSAANLTYKVPFVDGLSVKGTYNYDFTLNDNKIYQKSYYTYNYNAANNTYSSVLQQSPSTVRREVYELPANLQQLSLNYEHTFGQQHHITGLMLYEQSDRQADNFFGQREVSIPVDQLNAGNSLNQQTGLATSSLYHYTNASYVGRFNYDYKGKYLAEFSFRDDGSSRFPPGHKWGFFPAGSLGWRISDEGFWKNNKILSAVNNLKLRASYGQAGDDASAGYQYIVGYNYPASGSATGLPGGSVFDGVYYNGVTSRGIPNPVLTWTQIEFYDAGIDIEAWNGLFGLTFDVFRRNRNGLLASQLLTLPDVVGSALPQQNLNGDRTQGFDFEISHRNHIGKVAYNIKGTFGFTRTMYTTFIKAQAGNSYLNWINNGNLAGRYNNVYFGYGSNGQFPSYSSIENSSIYVAKNTVVGDYRYQDWNGDGQISTADSHPIADTGLPLIQYGFNLGVAYKGFDVNAQFQGAAMVSATYVEQLKEPLWSNGGALQQFMDRWHPSDPSADPYSPATVWVPGYYAYTGSLPYTNTSENLHSAAYVRLKSLDVGYSLPSKWLTRSGIKGVRIYFNGYNLLTFTTLKYIDPEHPSGISQFTANSNQYDYAYPLDKIYSLGVNLKF